MKSGDAVKGSRTESWLLIGCIRCSDFWEGEP
jgi:hypothetical protein